LGKDGQKPDDRNPIDTLGPIDDFAFSLRFDSRPVEFVAGELETVCPLCGGEVELCYGRRLELFFERDDGDPRVVCDTCGLAHASQLLGLRDAYRRISDPLDSFVEESKAAYIRHWRYVDIAAGERVEELPEAESSNEH